MTARAALAIGAVVALAVGAGAWGVGAVRPPDRPAATTTVPPIPPNPPRTTTMASADKPQPATLPQIADAAFTAPSDDALLALQTEVAMEDGPRFSIAAPARLDPAARDTLPVLLASRIDKHRSWDVESTLNMLVAVSDLASETVTFHFPLASGKPVLEEGRSRFGPEPEKPWEKTAFASVTKHDLPLGGSAEGGRTLATTAIYFDWRSATVKTLLAGAPRVAAPDAPTSAAWLKPDVSGDPALPPPGQPGLNVQRFANGVIVAHVRLPMAKGMRARAATLLMVRKDDFTAHSKRIVAAAGKDGDATFAVELGRALGAGKDPPEQLYLFAGDVVIGPVALSQ